MKIQTFCFSSYETKMSAPKSNSTKSEYLFFYQKYLRSIKIHVFLMFVFQIIKICMQMANKRMKRCSTSGKCKSKPQWDITSHLSEWLLSKRQEITSAGEGVEKREPLFFYLFSGNVNWCNHCGKQYQDSSKKLKIEPSYDSAIPLLGICPKKMKTLIQTDNASHVHCSIIYNSQDMEIA